MFPHTLAAPFANTVTTATPASESTGLADEFAYPHPPAPHPAGVVSHSGPHRDLRVRDHLRRHRPRRPDPVCDRAQARAYYQTAAAAAAVAPARPAPSPAESPYSSGELHFVYFVGSLTKDDFVAYVALSLDRHAHANDNRFLLPTFNEPESVYFSVSRPDIPTEDYVRRLVTYTQCSPAAFVVMLIYLDRVAKNNQKLHVTPFNMHRLLVTALTLACKVLDDRCFSNVHYAKVGGIPTAKEMNRLEFQFLKDIKYKLHVYESQYFDKLASLESLPPPSSPVSVNFELPPQGFTASSHDSDEIQSMITVATGGSSAADPCFRTRTDTTYRASVPTPMEDWQAPIRGGRNELQQVNGKRVRKQRHHPDIHMIKYGEP